MDHLHKLAEEVIEEAKTKRKMLLRKRQDRKKLATAGEVYEKFATRFLDLLEAYSGLTEVAKGVNPQYGGLVCGSLSLLFIVFISTHWTHFGQIVTFYRSARTKRPMMPHWEMPSIL